MGGPERVKYEVLDFPPRFMGDISYIKRWLCVAVAARTLFLYTGCVFSTWFRAVLIIDWHVTMELDHSDE